MRRLLPHSVSLASVLASSFTHAIHEDEAGLHDFLIRTAGHGVPGGVHVAASVNGGSAVLTFSSSSSSPAATEEGDWFEPLSHRRRSSLASGGCHLTSRDADTGDILWRRDVRSSSSSAAAGADDDDGGCAIHVSDAAGIAYTVDSSSAAGIVRGWNVADGSLLFDRSLFPDNDGDEHQGTAAVEKTRVIGADLPSSSSSATSAVVGTVVTTSTADERLILHDPFTGEIVSTLHARELLDRTSGVKAVKGGTAAFLGIVPLAATGEVASAAVVVGWTTSNDGGEREASLGSLAVFVVTPHPTSTVPLSSKGTNSDGGEEFGSAEQQEKATSGAAVAAAAASSLSVGKIAYDVGDPFHLRLTGGSAPTAALPLQLFPGLETGRFALLAASNDRLSVVALDGDLSSSGKASASLAVWPMDDLHPYWRSVGSVLPNLPGGGRGSAAEYVRIVGMDDRYDPPKTLAGLFRFNPSKGGEIPLQLYLDEEETLFDAVWHCSESSLLVAFETGDDGSDDEGGSVVTVFDVSETELTKQGAPRLEIRQTGSVREGVVTNAHPLTCGENGGSALLKTVTGTTLLLNVDVIGRDVEVTVKWTAEEALGSVTSSVFLDETHAIDASASSAAAKAGKAASGDDEDEEALLESLSLPSRLSLQLGALRTFFAGGLLDSLAPILAGDSNKRERDYAFGFAKVAVLLSEPLHKLVAIDTATKGRIVWTTDLNVAAAWHRLLHGGASTAGHAGGGAAGAATHGHDVLAVSGVPPRPETANGEARPASVEWRCLDGIRGRLHSSGTIDVGSPVVQVVPLRSSAPQLIHGLHEGGGCRQVALLLHADDTMTVVPDHPYARRIVADAAVTSGGKNGLFVHSVDRTMGAFRSLRVAVDAGDEMTKEGGDALSFHAELVGETSFDPAKERVVTVAYPRPEVVQSPATVLGDDSLLLKYLNPHLAVVVTEATDDFVSGFGKDDSAEGDTDPFRRALTGAMSESGASGPRKPLGATKPGEEPAKPTPSSGATTPPPTLFVNLVDTVSGRILHRASHVHALDDEGGGRSGGDIPVLVSENWVIYAIPNARTRRTEIGVLTLHEGMIDKHGMTAFKGPEQELTFSSLESAGPIVLSKTYGVAKPVTALGVTTTRGGISSRHVLLATGSDQIVEVDRKFLDPRRPSGEVKESEKKEGLLRYAPLIPLIPLLTPSYNQEVSSVDSIVSTSANVESQSLVLAYGGPDVFFTRLAPSKGFDLLPDNFNKGLLTMVVIGLLVVLNTVKQMGTKKMVTLGWS